MPTTVIHAASFLSSYGGSFIASLKRLHNVGRIAGVRNVLVFPDEARNRIWFGQLDEQGVPVRTVSASRSVTDRTIELIAVAKQEKAMIIHTHFTQFDMSAFLAKELMRFGRPGMSIIWHAHSNFGVQRNLRRMARDVIKWKASTRRVSTIIAVSEHVRASLIDKGVCPEKIKVVWNGIDVDRLRDHALEVRGAKKDSGVNGGALVLFMHGWNPVVKGVDIAVEALRILRIAGKPAILLISGDDNVRQKIKHMAEDLPDEWVRVVPQIEDVGRYYASASVFVSASRSEGFSYSILEAVSMGVPVVASCIGGTAWASIIPSVATFEPENPADMVRAIQDVAAWDPRERRERCDSGAALVADLYGVDQWARNILDIYASLLKD